MVNGFCQKGWEEYKKRCYKMSESLVPFSEYEATCRKWESKPLSIMSQEENDWINGLMVRKGKDKLWLGARINPEKYPDINSRSPEVNKDDIWQWIDGNQLKYSNWGLPNAKWDSDSNNSCVYMDAYKWYDWNCSQSLPHVCYREQRDIFAGILNMISTIEKEYVDLEVQRGKLDELKKGVVDKFERSIDKLDSIINDFWAKYQDATGYVRFNMSSGGVAASTTGVMRPNLIIILTITIGVVLLIVMALAVIFCYKTDHPNHLKTHPIRIECDVETETKSKSQTSVVLDESQSV